MLNAAATGGEIVRVRRISDPANDLVDFQNGSVLTESELDRSYLHNRYLAEESAEQNDISLRVQAGADGQFDALNKKIINVSDPTANQDAATKAYVDTKDALKVAKAGDTMSGDLAMGGNKVTGLGAPTSGTDGATKTYVDDAVADVVGGSIPDNSITANKISDTDTIFNIQSDGSVGVGTDTPSSKLTVDGDIESLRGSGPGGGQIILRSPSDGSYRWNIDNESSSSLFRIFQEADSGGSGAVRLTIDPSTGNVKLGSGVGAYTLDVGGDVNVTGNFKVNGTNISTGTGTVTSVDSGTGLTGGPITTSGTLSIADNGVTFAKMQDINTAKVIGRTTAGSGDPEEVSILDEDTMTSDSNTALATQQSIKAYVDAQVGSGTVNKWDSGWVDQDDSTSPVSVGSGATMVLDHNLGAAAVGSVFSVYAAEDNSGTDMEAQKYVFWEDTAGADLSRGIQVKSITSTQVTVQLGGQGYSISSAGNYGSKVWGTSINQFSHIRVVLVG